MIKKGAVRIPGTAPLSVVLKSIILSANLCATPKCTRFLNTSDAYLPDIFLVVETNPKKE